MPNRIYKVCFFVTAATFPLITHGALEQTQEFFQSAKDIITQTLIPLVFTLALLFFFWGVAKYIWSAEQDKEQAKKIMVWGVVALFVMSSIWGIIYLLRSEFNVEGDTQMPIPTFE